MTGFYAGLDVSDKTTRTCAIDTDGKVAWRGVCAASGSRAAASAKEKNKRSPPGGRFSLPYDVVQLKISLPGAPEARVTRG